MKQFSFVKYVETSLIQSKGNPENILWVLTMLWRN